MTKTVECAGGERERRGGEDGDERNRSFQRRIRPLRVPRGERAYNIGEARKKEKGQRGVGERGGEEREKGRSLSWWLGREGGGKVDRGLSHYACSEETTGLDAGTAAIGS